MEVKEMEMKIWPLMFIRTCGSVLLYVTLGNLGRYFTYEIKLTSCIAANVLQIMVYYI